MKDILTASVAEYTAFRKDKEVFSYEEIHFGLANGGLYFYGGGGDTAAFFL
jgi:hypothetical protein